MIEVIGSGLTVREYEGLVLAWPQQHLTEELGRLRDEGREIRVEEIRLEVSNQKRMLAGLFRDEASPECLFGWHFPSNDVEEADPEARRSWETEQAEVWAGTIVLTNLEEQILAEDLGLSSACEPEGVTWVGECLP
jgi:hypothetical protein